MDRYNLDGGELYRSGGTSFTVLLWHGDRESAAKAIGGDVLCPDCEWNRDLPPWDAPALSPSSEDFKGGADAFLNRITGTLLPQAFGLLSHVPPAPVIAGYSMSGLFAAYATMRTDVFRLAACVSPSLWYDGFADYMTENVRLISADKIYFSVGRKEKRTRNRRMASVEDCISRCYTAVSQAGIESIFELNDGDHFTDPVGRMSKALRWLLERTI